MKVWQVIRAEFNGDENCGLYASMDVVRREFPSPIVWTDISYQGTEEWKGEVSGQSDPEYRAELRTVQE